MINIVKKGGRMATFMRHRSPMPRGIPKAWAAKTTATPCIMAVPSMFMVAPSKMVKDEILRDTPISRKGFGNQTENANWRHLHDHCCHFHHYIVKLGKNWKQCPLFLQA